jgi:4-carboxymuconolactone decarboxylase
MNMKQILSITILSFLLWIGIATHLGAQHSDVFPRGQKAPNVHHTGDVWLSILSRADSTFNHNVAVAIFAPGAKLNWHLHPAGQQLIITDGKGYYQERNQPVQIVRKGEMIKCTPGVEHWHGAAPDTSVTYLAISGNQPTQWAEPIAQAFYDNIEKSNDAEIEKTIIQLSKDKWQWMAGKNVDKLQNLFLEQSKFVHMGGTWGKGRELEIIKSGGIHYKKADIHETSVEIMGSTAILLNRITLLAVVGGNEVTNPFMVTEVYLKQSDGNWKLGSLSFTKLLNQN